jgi:hypothetical protein
MTFNSRGGFVLFLIIWLIVGNIVAAHLGIHTVGPFGYCAGYGCK